MSGETLFFCLSTGAAMGCLFLLFKLLRLLLGAGKLLTALLDVLCCLLCALCVFLCALALDRGRLRLYQVLLQGIGAWAFIQVFDPLITRLARFAARWGKKIFCRLSGVFRRAGGFLTAHFRPRRRLSEKKRPKPGKNRKKAEKKT